MVSVIIPCHNNNSTINRAVASALGQTYEDIEVIIVDNGSDEKLRLNALIEADPRVRIYSFARSMNAAGARNFGVKKARGEYIAYLDADDYWHADKLRKQMRVMLYYRYNNKAPRICFTARRIVFKKRGTLVKGALVHTEKVVDYKRLLRTNQINCSSVLLKREDALRFPFPSGDIHEDYVVWLRILKDGGYAVGIDRPLLYYYYSKESKSGNKMHSAVMTFKVYRLLGLGLMECMMHMATYTIEGLKKYRIDKLLHYFSI